MADAAGPGGTFSATNFTAHFSGWAYNVAVTLVENTGFAENGNRTSIPTAQIVIGSCSGTQIQSTSPLPNGITGSTPSMSSYTGTFILTSYTGGNISFIGNLSNVAVSRQFDGKADFSASFQSSGTLSLANA